MIEKKDRRQMERKGTIQYKSDEEEKYNPYDSEEEEFRNAQANKDEDSSENPEDGSYDSELEAEFFGNKNPDAQDESFPQKEQNKEKKQ